MLVLAGCGGGSSSSISISLPGSSLVAGQSVQLKATETSSDGPSVDVTGAATWSSSNTAVATVSASGVLTGVKAGSSTISATVKKTTGTLLVTVGAGAIQSVTITPNGASLSTGSTQQFTATATYSDGSTGDITSSVAWSATPATVATISTSGLLKAVSPGSFTVTANSGSVSAAVSGTVSTPTLTALAVSPTAASIASGATQQFTATGTYSDSSTKDLSSAVTWSSSNPAQLTISSTGLATAGTIASNSSATITATLGSLTATSAVTLTTAATMTSLVVRPTSSSIAPDTAEQHTATAYYSDGTQADVTSQVSWASTNTSVAPTGSVRRAARRIGGSGGPAAGEGQASGGSGNVSVDPSGVDTANQVGSASLTATLGTFSSQSVVLVRDTTIKSVVISSTELEIPAQAQQQFTLSGTFADGSMQDLSLTAGWQSSNPGVATIDSSGRLTAVSAGTTSISAGFGGATATPVTVQVLPVDLVSLVLKIPYPTIGPGATEQLAVIGTFSDGTQQDVTSLASWSSSNTTVMSIDDTGFVQVKTSGRAEITATVLGVSTVSAIASEAATLQSIQVLPNGSNFALGTRLQFACLGTFSDGAQVDLSDQVLWTAADPTVLTINSTGLAKSGSVGSTTLTASYLGISVTTAAVNVTGATLSGITLAPTSARIASGTHQQYAATGWFNDGTVQDITADVTWSVSDPTVASVDSDGTVLGLKAGTVTVTASSQGQSVSAQLTVTNATLVSTIISPGNTELPAGVTRQFQLIGTFSDGTTQDMTADAIWQSPTPTIVMSVQQQILGEGPNPEVGTGVSPGIGTLGAVYGNFSSATQVTVTNATLSAISLTPASSVIRTVGQQMMTANGTFSDGFQQNLYLNVVFSLTNRNVATILNAMGTVYGTAVGTTQVTATFEGKTSPASTITVESGILSSIAITPSNPALTAGASQQLTATGTYADGTTSDLSSQMTWTSSNPAVLSVSASGLATAHAVTAVTTVTVTATYGSTTQSFTVTVSPANSGGGTTVSGLTMTPRTPDIAAGSTDQFTVTATYADGSTANVTGLASWSSSNNAVATVDTNGLATGTGVGTVTITASYGGQTANSTLSVGTQIPPDATLTSIAVVPGTATIAPTGTRQFTARGTYSNGATEDISSQVTWGSSNQTVATVSSAGVATGLAPGTAQITAQSGSLSGAATLTVSGPSFTSIAVTPGTATIAPGGTVQYHATATLPNGTTQDVTSSATWTSSSPAVATITGTGLASAVANGSTAISASLDGASGDASLTVATGTPSTPTLQSIAVTPATASVAAGGNQQYTATGTYSDGSTQDLTSTATWSSSDPSVAVVSSTGLASGVAAGSATITASSGSTTGTAALTVTGSGSTITGLVITPTSSQIISGLSENFTATATYGDGTTHNISSSVTWSTSNPAVALVNSSGQVTGVAPGTAVITGAAGSVVSQTTVVIEAAVLSSLAISPSGASFAAGVQQQFTLTATYSNGTRQDVTSTATWSSTAPSVATVSSAGLATGVAPGTTQITALFGTQSASTTVQITPATLVSVAVSPSSASFAKGTTQQFSVIGTYTDGSTQDLTSQATFSSSNPAVVSVTNSGLATGAGTGSAAVTASVNGQSATTQSVTVTPATLVSIAITPQTPSFAAGTTQQFTAIGSFTDGTTQDLTSQAVWYSNNPQVVTINSNGLASASTSTGTAQISCTLSGVSATTGNVTVTPAVLTSLAVLPSTAQIAKGTTQQFSATGTYSDGSTQNLSSTVSWTSSDATVASISASGLATGNNVGTAQITASFNGQTASTSSFSVTPATLVSIAFSPANPSVAAGTSAQVTVTGTFSDGSTQNLSSAATYSSSNPSAVTVNNSGLLTGVAPGSSTVTVTVGGVTSSFTANVTTATLTSISISPSNPASLPKGTTEQFTATGTYSDGSTQDLSSTAAWTSSSTSVLTVDTHGLASGAGVGTATLTATYQGFSGTTASVQVTPAVVASVAITPASSSLTAGSTQQYTATATYTDATTQDVTFTTTWSSSSPTVATVTATGYLVAVSQGTTTIAGVYNGITGSTSLTVNPVVAPVLSALYVSPSVASVAKGNTQQFAAMGFYSDGTMHDLTAQAIWQSSVPSVATVNSTGLATGVAGGNTQIWATAGGVSGVAALTVSPATLVSLSVSPAAVSLAKGTSQQYTAIGTLSDGSTEDLTTSVTWSSSATSVATINSSGFATSVGTGTTTISATAGGISGAGSMVVTSATVVSLLVTPATVALPAGGTQQLIVTALFTDGSSQNVTTSATYVTSNTGVVTADATGKVTATGTGTATLTISQGSTSTTIPVAITSAVLSAITVTPSPLSLAVGESQQMTATGNFTDGSTQNLTNSVAWTSSSPTVATVSLTGKVIASQSGTSTISATNGLITGSSTLTSTTAVVTSVTVSPASATLAAGQTQQYTATATMSDGSQQDVTSSAHWSTSNVANGTISNTAGSSGLLLTLAPGSFTVSATLNGTTGSGAVTVTSAILTSLTLTPSPVSLPAGTTQALTVTGNYSDGSTANVTSTATWTTSSASVASVATGGTLSAISPGSATVTAHVGLISATDSVTVTSAVLSSIAINLPSGSIPLGTQSQITATGTYTDGSTQDITSQVQWSSSTPSVATISSTGLITTSAAGTTQIGASLNGVTHQSTLTVSPAVLSSIAIQGSQSSFALGLSLQLTAVGTYSDNSTQNLTSLVTWSSLSPSVGVVSSSGVATGLTTGTFTAKATLNGVSGTLSITVTSAVLQSIVVTPANNTIVNLLGSSVQYTATGHFSDGSTQNITTTCHWAITSGLALGSISQTGSFSPLGVGLGTLSATSGSISGSTGFIVVSVL